MKKVLIVDDAAFMRLSLRRIIESDDQFEIVGEAENGRIGYEQYKILNPDIVTMDITMPEMDGIQALKHFVEYDPDATVVIISAMGQESYVRDAIISGAKGFIVKPFKQDNVIKTLSKL